MARFPRAGYHRWHLILGGLVVLVPVILASYLLESGDAAEMERFSRRVAYVAIAGLLLVGLIGLLLRRSLGENKEVQLALDSKQAFLDSILNSTADAIVTVDLEGQIRSTNLRVEALFDTSQQVLTKGSVDRLLPSAYQTRALDLEAIARSLDRQQPPYLREELVGLRRGQPFPVEVTFSRLRQPGEPLLLLMMRDLAPHKATERELDNLRMQYFQQEKVAQIGLLVAGIMHEVGNPLAAIRGLLEEILTEEDEGGKPRLPADYRSNLELVLQQAGRIRGMTLEVSGYLASGRGEQGLVDINHLLRSTAKLLSYDRRWKGIRLEMTLDPQLPAVPGVADQLTQVFMNLLVNASDAVADEAVKAPWVQVASYRVDGQSVCVCIRDNGNGIPEAALRQIFEPFFTTKGEGRGTGLGLPICERLVEDHHGSIEVESIVGEGTEFRVYLRLEPVSETREAG